MKLINYLLALTLIFGLASCKKSDDNLIENNQPNVTDIEGNSYKTVKIGSQVWMAENLKVTQFRNGDPIPNVKVGTEWVASLYAYCTYDNDESNKDIYGCLYSWGTITDLRGLAPEGWHIPTKEEFADLKAAIGGSKGAVKLGTWGGGTNESGFTALPAGERQWGSFVGLGTEANWWTSSKEPGVDPVGFFLINSSSRFDVFNSPTGWGLSVRCVKD